MTPKEAIDLIDRVCSQVSLPRDGHIKVQEAINILTIEIGNGNEEKKILALAEKSGE